LEQNALKDSLFISTAHFEHVQTSTQQPFAAGYELNLKLGEQVNIYVTGKGVSRNWLLEIYDNANILLREGTLKNDTLLIEAKFDEPKKVKILLQARLSSNAQASFVVVTRPRYIFPVSGKGNGAIQSFWGASRGGGSRSHEGNDIFASRGTPVVAAVDGVVSSVRDKGLGGRQVWLRENETGFSLYYAHLDSWSVEDNQQVKQGDTLGQVGNTGNARTTPPHLHFGIYTRNGAVDPKPFIWEQPEPVATKLEDLPKSVKTKGNSANLRLQPDARGSVITLLPENMDVVVLGMLSSWYHVRTIDGSTGYLHSSVVE
jgi:murein DD-endopeptidase MepM/ murein hydrolase activator NlpD